MQQSIAVLTLSIAATGTIAQKRFVTFAGAQAGAAANTFGVAKFDALSGDILACDVMGTAVVEAGGAIAAGAALETDADGKAVTKDEGATVARAIGAAAAEGDFIEVLLLPN